MKALTACLFLSLTGMTAQAGDAQLPGAHLTRSPKTPTIAATRAIGELRIDGIMNESAWKSAAIADSFTQSFPNPNAVPRQRTEVRVIYDSDALYVGVRAFDTHPDSIAAPLARRDVLGIYSDWISVSIDSYHDRRTSVTFAVNPRGVKKDELISNDNSEDFNWDAVWQVATTVDSLGWTAEFRIPFSQLKFGAVAPGAERMWGFEIQRDIARYKERDSWAPWTADSPGYVSSFGDLRGLRDIPVPDRLELVPYVSAKVTRAPGTSANPFFQRNDTRPSLGGDLTYGLPSGLTLTATVNPDFGQVEVDPAVVNLTAFETFFPEKRPFFLEGSDIFQFGQVQTDASYNSQIFYYSRRIGRAPQLAVTGSETGSNIAYVDAPDQSSILGAVKVAGKTHGWAVGLMDGVTNKETARYVTTDGVHGTAPVEPLTNYAVGRVRRDFDNGNSSIGGMMTATNRSIADTMIGNALRSRAFLGGIDFDHAWDARQWILSGYVTGSHVDGSPAAITATQESSAHYYQRPDAGYLGVDTTLTSLTGHMAEFALAKRGKWFGSLDYKEVSPGFEINDLGYLSRADYRVIVPDVSYQSNDPGRIFRSYSVFGASFNAWNFGHTMIRQSNDVGVNGTFNNLWSAGLEAVYSPDQLSDQLTRGGPLATLPAQWELDGSISSDSRRAVIASGEVQYQRDAAGGGGSGASLTIDARPNSVVHLSLGPAFSVVRSSNQYAQTVTDPLATGTYGHRYVFADLRQTTLSMDTRLDWTFTTNLSLQLYAQPFISAGSYTSFKELLAPRTRRFGVYGDGRGTIDRDAGGVYTIDPDAAGAAPAFEIGDPDFNTRSLRGDAVLRWEYRPGSAIFFVWQQQRSGTEPVGDFGFNRDAGAIFREQPTNIFLVKATFWLAR